MSSTTAPKPEHAAAAAHHRAMPAVVRHPFRALTQVRVTGVLEADAQLHPAHDDKPAHLLLLLRPQRGLPYLARMDLSPADELAVHSEAANLRRGALLSVAGQGLEIIQHDGTHALRITHAQGLVIPH